MRRVTLSIVSLIAFSTLVTSSISGILGMAGGMILLGVLLAVLPLPAAMMLHGISQLASNGGRALMLRREVDWRVRRGHSFVCGLVCLALSLTAGIAGPILDVFFVRSSMSRHAVVATKALTQAL